MLSASVTDKTLRLVPNGRVTPNFLARALRSTEVRRQIMARATGTSGSMCNISQATIREISIHLPPLPEQRRIAALLDQADGIRRKRREAIVLAESLLRSAFLEMFGDPVGNPRGWEVVRFDTVGQLDRGKSQHRPRNDPALLGGPYPLIQTGEVAGSGGEITEYTRTYSELSSAKLNVPPTAEIGQQDWP